MAARVSPQRENGHLDVANELAEAFARTRLNSTQSCILWVILRQTYGWNKKMDRISLQQFADATGIHPKQVARELGRLAARKIIVEWGDDHHPKQYGIQKDYTRWVVDEKVSTKTLTPAEHKVSTETLQSVNVSVPKVSTETLTTITSNTTSTEPNGSGTLRDRYLAEYRRVREAGGNWMAVIGDLFTSVLGAEPNYARLGRLSKEVGGGSKLIQVIIAASQQTIGDDPHDYLAAMVRNEKHRGGGRQRQADQNSGKTGEMVI